MIGYLPVLSQSFASRELRILLLDARAGSPPSAAELLLRRGGDPEKLEERLGDWEEWALDLLQTHLSYPMLAYYRSQHPISPGSWSASHLPLDDQILANCAVPRVSFARRWDRFVARSSRPSHAC
jgi:hypothetical protein